jgi:hypothetical protein
MDNVIPFPKNNQNAIPTDIDEVESRLEQLKFHHINEAISVVVPILFSYLESAGFEFDGMDEEDDGLDDPNIKDAAFMVEAIRSLLCKHHNMDHPFQQISEGVFEQDAVNKGVFSLVKKLSIEFKNVEKGNS